MAKPVDREGEVRRRHEAAVAAFVRSGPAALPPAKPSLFVGMPVPVDVARLMANVARVTGVTVAAVGALFALMVASQVTPGQVASSLVGTQSAQLIETAGGTPNDPTLVDTTIGTITNTTQEPVINSTLNAQQSYMQLSMEPPLRGKVRVRVHTPQAHAVDIFLFSQSWQNKERLGNAVQVSTGVWEYQWDTTTVESGLSYRLSAAIWDASATDLPENFTVQLNYMLVDNAPLQPIASSTPTLVVDQKPAAAIQVPSTVSGDVPVLVTVANATAVALQLEHVPSGTRNTLYNGVLVSPGEWRFRWRTLDYSNGDYRLVARVTNSFGSYLSPVRATKVANPTAAADQTVTTDALQVTTAEKLPTPTTNLLPTLRLRVADKAVLDGTERLEVDTTGTGIQNVFFYVRDAASTMPRFIGAAQQGTGTRWSMNWFTGNTPNGTYTLFALAQTTAGQIESGRVQVSIANEVPQQTVQSTEKELDTELQEVVKVMTEPLRETKNDDTDEATEEQEEVREVIERSQPLSDSEQIAEDLIADSRESLNDALMRLGTAYRTGDTAAQERIRARIDELIATIVSASPYRDRAEIQSALSSRVAALVSSYTTEVVRVDSILNERQRADIRRDTDGDGLSDFDEVSIFKTDPSRADSDGDGFTDGAEILSGFDPLSDARESAIVYESPKVAGVFREDILKINAVEALPLSVASEEVVATGTATTTLPAVVATTTVGLRITGTALPNSFATIYIFSTPIIVTVKTNEEGAFEYRFEKELEDGEHNVYVGITDNAGRVVAKSQPLRFIKEAQAITPTEAASIDTALAPAPETDLLSNRFMSLVVAVSVVAIGLILIMLGMHLDARRRRFSMVGDFAGTP